jgi:hypothetical protein
MELRGYRHRSPLHEVAGPEDWPAEYVDSPGEQLALLRRKYREREAGRIPLPRNRMQLWAAHKYSVLARDQAAYRALGRRIAARAPGTELDALAAGLVDVLRRPPRAGDLRNALEHMWGHVSEAVERPRSELGTPRDLLGQIVAANARRPDRYLEQSTALSDLAAW